MRSLNKNYLYQIMEQKDETIQAHVYVYNFILTSHMTIAKSHDVSDSSYKPSQQYPQLRVFSTPYNMNMGWFCLVLGSTVLQVLSMMWSVEWCIYISWTKDMFCVFNQNWVAKIQDGGCWINNPWLIYAWPTSKLWMKGTMLTHFHKLCK